VADRGAFVEAMARQGVLMMTYTHGLVRAVTHYGVDERDVDRTIAAAARVLGATLTAPALA